MTRTSIGTVCSEEQAQELNAAKQAGRSLNDVPDLPQTRLVTTGTLVGIKDPTDEEVRDLMRVAGSTCMNMRVAGIGRMVKGCVLIPKVRARQLYNRHTFSCAGFCPVCILRAEGYQF